MSEQKRLVLADLGPSDGRRLIDMVAGAHLVCFPTDTVYGVGGLLRPATGERIRDAKRHAPDKPLQVVFPSVEALVGAVPMGPRTLAAVGRLLPGGLTLLVPYPDGFEYPPPGVVTMSTARGPREVATLGVRAPRWPEAARALGALPFPLLASSANRSGDAPPGSLDEMDPEVLAVCDLVLDGGRVAGVASSVVDLTAYEGEARWRLLRTGAVGEDEVVEMLARERDDLPR